MRERERQALASAAGLLNEYLEWAQDAPGKFSQRADRFFSPDLLQGPNGEVLNGIVRRLHLVGDGLDGLFRQMEKLLDGTRDDLAEAETTLVSAQNQQELAFRDLIQKHAEAQGKATERGHLERKRNELLVKKQKHEEMQARMAQLRSERETLLGRLQDLRNERFGLRKAVAVRITSEIASEMASPVRVQVEQCGNRDLYQSLLASALKNAGVQQNVVAGKIASTLPPGEFADLVRAGNAAGLVQGADLSDSQAEKVVKALAGSAALLEVEAVELIDLPHIELQDGAEFKDSLALSTGQKCTTILPILLMKSENPLMVDQPEDNLDNRFIYDTIVNSIHRVKPHRQLVLVTHNPNISVLGEAEKVFVLTSNGAQARKANEGSVDQCKAEIVNLLEGGEEAFIRRKERYSY